MTVGKALKETLLNVEQVTVKANEDIEKGEVIYNDGSSFLAMPNTVTCCKAFIAMEAHVYSEETDHVIRAAQFGYMGVQKVAGVAVVKGDKAMISSTAGEVTKWTCGSSPWAGASSLWSETLYQNLQTALNQNCRVIGTFGEDAGSSVTVAKLWLGVY